MKLIRIGWWGVVAVVIALTPFIAGCDPPLDNALSPPIITSPIYECAEVIGFGGADRESKIWVYVNGIKVKEVDSFWGRGEITLPSALSAGDVVSARQIVGGKRSAKTREPVTVVTIPSSLLLSGEKIKNPPEIIPPLYDCQKVVILKKVINGAKVTLRDEDGNTWSGITPYTTHRQGTSELKEGVWLDAMQELCADKYAPSDWSAKVTVQPKPTSLPDPPIREPVPHGSDTCIVDELTIGAKVDIYKDVSGGPVRIGGGHAWGGSTLYKVSEAFDQAYSYYAVQGLCEVESPKPDEPTKPTPDVPAPSVQSPICDQEYYVTVCGTVVGSTIKVYADGTQVAQAAGNGGCVKMALGNSTAFATGQNVTAKQFVAGTASADSAAVKVTVDGAPSYNPGMWNDSFHIRRNNCYAYACDILCSPVNETKQQPGRASGDYPNPFTCTDIGNAAMSDGLTAGVEKQCSGCTHLVALVIAPGGSSGSKPMISDYHWYRLDDNGHWSHKPGWTPATKLDASDNTIPNPETADRYYEGEDYILDYSIFCTYYCVDKDVVKIE